MKYIDADKLIAEIERWRDKAKEKYNKNPYCMGRCDALAEFRNHIVSLQQEQPKQKKNCNDCPHCVDRKDQYGWHFKGCFGGPYKGKFIAEIDECPLEQEHSEVDLEKEISTWIPAHIRGGDNEEWKDTKKAVTEWGGIVARHFYELGKNARKE